MSSGGALPHSHPMARKYTKRPRPPETPADEIFGGLPEDDASEVPAMLGEQPEEPPLELLALGPPPADAIGMRKWNYQVLSTMIALAVRDTTISNETRAKRIVQLSAAAAKHYDDAARHDLDQRIKRDAEEIAGKKRARAAAQMERRPPAGDAKVIPRRSDA